MRATRANIRSTKPASSIPKHHREDNKRTHEFFTKIIEPTGKVFSDQTGKFPVTSSRGNKYVMVVYDHDSNATLTVPLKSKSAADHLQAITKIHSFLNSKGIFPKLHIMDNECSNIVKNYIKTSKHIELLLVPPHSHRANMAEKAIDIFKNHFVAGLATVHPSFPLHLWCRLLPLATTTLNLLRPL